ncbi:Hercynylcysteine sulfoxide lyase [Candida viswanathii]|uniref:Hercynylcysteine sulfoxide lyase n=1 Tax=Candida viswanathii TaxID=5486 RepID=A0A367Y582_9ASCO|nr:Hercynylcysteine sulfoxide lyase [Candida viswanathii]
MTDVPFGKQFRETYFTSLSPDLIPVNHGSSGAIPTPAAESYIRKFQSVNQFPDKFFRVEKEKAYVDSLKCVAEVFSCDYHDLALLDNATTAVNTVLRGLSFQPGDVFVYHSTCFGACKETMKYMEANHGIKLVEIELLYPTTQKEIVAKFREVFEKYLPKLCLFDVISSMPAMLLPYVELTELCKDFHVLSLVDGSHSVGTINPDLSALKPDFFVSLLHKWYFVPRPCCVMYVNPIHHATIQPFPVYKYSNGRDSTLIDKFSFWTTRNHIPIAIIPEVHKFRNEVCRGELQIYEYCHELAVKVGKLLSERWGTSYLSNEMQITTMVNVEVPFEVIDNWKDIEDQIARELVDKNAFIPSVVHNGKLYARFSAQIYTELEDFSKAGKVLMDVLDRFK